jgi:AraC-like DNA-binding protein
MSGIQNRPLVSTMLAPSERARVDAAGLGLYESLHRESLEDVLSDVRERNVAAVLVSVAGYSRVGGSQLAMVVRDFPRVTAVALVTESEPLTPQTTLQLGQLGIHTLIDARSPGGWSKLRNLLTPGESVELRNVALTVIRKDLGAVPPDCWRFFELIFVHEVQLEGVRGIARGLRVVPSTLLSRFFRASLPAPKLYLAYARLIRAAHLFEDTGRTVANVADSLDYSSPQAFGRHVQRVLGISPVAFRHSFTGTSMLEYFRQELVLAHAATLRNFHPGLPSPNWAKTAARYGRLRIRPDQFPV